MPNDMSAPPALPEPPSRDALLSRAARYAERGQSLATTIGLSRQDAIAALAHLARMQDDVAQDRLQTTRRIARELERAARPYKAQEEALKSARAALSEALLHTAETGSHDDQFGLVAHGTETSEQDPISAVSACRAILDLEALRPFFSDHALRQAIAKQAKVTGKCAVNGVTYAALPKTAVMPADIR